MGSAVRKRVVIVGIYLPGIYPPGDDTVVADLLAPAYLKSVVQADPELSGWDVCVLPLPASLTGEQTAERILAENPTVLAYSVYIWNYDLVQASSEVVRRLAPSIRIICGGPEVSYNAQEILQINTQFDVIVSGAGETRFRMLLKSEFVDKNMTEIPGITFRDSHRMLRTTPANGFQEDLAAIPSPYQTGVIDLEDGRKHCVSIETYRGCIFACGFCMWMGDKKKSLTLFPIEQILRDIEIIYSNPNVAFVYFVDASIFYTRDRAKLILDKIREAPRRIPTVFTLDIAFLNEELIAGLSELQLTQQKYHFGMQSTNSETLRLMGRRIGPDIFTKRIEMLRGIDPGAEVSFDLIYGLPGDDYESFRNTVEFSLTLSPSKLNLSPLVLLPGSPFWRDREMHGFVFDPTPPYLILSNSTYSADDMRKTRKLVLGVILALYFPAIRDTIYAVANRCPTLRRIDLIDKFIEIFEKKSNLLLDVSNIRDQDQYSTQTHNMIRRHIMNRVALFENCLHAYESMLELIRALGQMDLADTVLIGIQYYRAMVDDDGTAPSLVERFGRERVDQVQFSWVVANPEPASVPGIQKTSTGGVAAIC